MPARSRLALQASRSSDPLDVLAAPVADASLAAAVAVSEITLPSASVTVVVTDPSALIFMEAGAAHNVHFRAGPAKTIAGAMDPMLNTGDGYAVKFIEPGTYNYICTPHSAVMKGKVIVE